MHQSVYELVHTEDQLELRRNLHWALNPPLPATPATAQDSPQGDRPHFMIYGPILELITLHCVHKHKLCKHKFGDQYQTVKSTQFRP